MQTMKPSVCKRVFCSQFLRDKEGVNGPTGNLYFSLGPIFAPSVNIEFSFFLCRIIISRTSFMQRIVTSSDLAVKIQYLHHRTAESTLKTHSKRHLTLRLSWPGKPFSHELFYDFASREFSLALKHTKRLLPEFQLMKLHCISDIIMAL